MPFLRIFPHLEHFSAFFFCPPFHLSAFAIILLLPIVSGLQNITVSSSDSSINYEPGQGVWDAIGDSGASSGAYRLARTQDGVATISRTFRSLYFTSPLWPFPLQIAITVGSTAATIDLQDHSVSGATPPPTGLTPSSKSSGIRWSFHGIDSQRTVQVRASSSSTGWIALVDSFIFEVAQPGDAPVSNSPPSSPPISQPPSSGDNNGGGNSGGSGGSDGNSGGSNPGNNSPSPTSTSQGSNHVFPPSTASMIISGILQPSPLSNGSLSLTPNANGGQNDSINSTQPDGTHASMSVNPDAASHGSATGVAHSSDPSSGANGPFLPVPTFTSAGDSNHGKKFPIGILIGVICAVIFMLAIGGWVAWYMKKRHEKLRDSREGEAAQKDWDDSVLDNATVQQAHTPFDSHAVAPSGTQYGKSLSLSPALTASEIHPTHMYVQGSTGLVHRMISGSENDYPTMNDVLEHPPFPDNDGAENSHDAYTKRPPTEYILPPNRTHYPTSPTHSNSDVDYESIDTASDLVPVRRPLGASRTQSGRSTSSQLLSRGLPSPPSVSSIDHINTKPYYDGMPLYTDSEKPLSASATVESTLYRAPSEESHFSSPPRRIQVNVPSSIRHQNSRSQLTLGSHSSATPPPQYSPRWTEGHEVYARQHQELMSTLEGYFSAENGQTDDTREARQLYARRMGGGGGIPTPPDSIRGSGYRRRDLDGVMSA